MGQDVIDIEILEDGTIKASTSKISAANHLSADGFFSFLSRLCGAKAERKAKGNVVHTHSHEGVTHSH